MSGLGWIMPFALHWNRSGIQWRVRRTRSRMLTKSSIIRHVCQESMIICWFNVSFVSGKTWLICRYKKRMPIFRSATVGRVSSQSGETAAYNGWIEHSYNKDDAREMYHQSEQVQKNARYYQPFELGTKRCSCWRGVLPEHVCSKTHSSRWPSIPRRRFLEWSG